ncbi:MAG: OmpH family outer membrane protein [Candidatus Dadabacteria bacterium]|nr:MAG: OmpH family outer membrane protein [Candidatus Dadabacteria bacterium]
MKFYKGNSALLAAVIVAFIVQTPFFAFAGDGLGTWKGKIALVDMKRVLAECIQGKAAKEEFEKAVDESQAKLKPLQAEVEKLKKDLERQAGVLSESAYSAKEEQLYSKAKELKRSLKKERDRLGEMRIAQLNKVINKASEVVKELARQKGYKVVLEMNAPDVIYSDGKGDITDLVISKLNHG